MYENKLVAVSRPEVHARIHQSDNAAIEVLSLISLMKQEVARDPSVPISKKYFQIFFQYDLFFPLPYSGQIKKKILDRELHGKIGDETRLENILSAFPLRVENTLVHYRGILMGQTGGKRRKYKKHLCED